MKPPTVMFLGTSPHSAKSTVAIGVCRLLSDAGYRVLPFKAVSMSEDADGLRPLPAGPLQHHCNACRCQRDGYLNPIVAWPQPSSPEAKVLVLGEEEEFVRLPCDDTLPMDHLSEDAYARRVELVEGCFRQVASEADAVVVEGAGGPLDLPLQRELPNIHLAQLCEAPIVLTAKFSKGGEGSNLIGTFACLPEDLRQRVRGFVFSHVAESAAALHSVRLVESHTGIPGLGLVAPVNLQVPDTYKELACAVRHLEWGQAGLPWIEDSARSWKVEAAC